MKKTILTLAVALFLGSTANAQDNQDRPQRPRMDRQELTQRRTDMMVKQYGLNDQQAKQLLELNTEFAKKMGPGSFGPRPAGGPRPRRNFNGERPNGAVDSMRPPMPQGFNGQNGRPNMSNEEMQKRRAQREETQKAYQAELQKIMTAEQFSQYQADEANRRQMGPRRGGPGRANQE